MKKGIKVEGEKINGCRVKLGDLKNLITSYRGVLIFRYHTLFFVSYPDMKVNFLCVKEEAVNPAFFTSTDFGDILQLRDNDREYILEFRGNFLFLRDPITGEIKVEIKGKGV